LGVLKCYGQTRRKPVPDDLFPPSTIDRSDPLYFASGQYLADSEVDYGDGVPEAWKKFFFYLAVLVISGLVFSLI
tara:strand:- start:2489 stop:2713 length:225 start_codon:yes stop_codon:yes gene_type:complete